MATSNRTDRPQPTKPGEGAADTLDPTERVSSVAPDKAKAARDGHGTVNAVVPVESAPTPSPTVADADHRIERSVERDPSGRPVTVERNLDTGESRIVKDGD